MKAQQFSCCFYLRTRDLGKRNLPIQHAQKLVHECLPHIVYFIPCAPCFHSHHCPLIVGWTSVALLQGTCGNAASALPPGLIVPTKLILLPQIRAHSTKDIFKHSCSFPPPSSTACVSCGIWVVILSVYAGCNKYGVKLEVIPQILRLSFEDYCHHWGTVVRIELLLNSCVPRNVHAGK